MWWSPTAFGMAHGWVIDAAPEGQGAVTLAVAVPGALVEIEEGEASALLVAEDGRRWRYDSLAAWDAAGTPLPAWLEADGDALLVRVDDRGAVYPIEVDPLVTTPDILSSTGTGPFAGGDGDGDGYADVVTIVGNTASVFLGTASGISTTASQSFTSPLAGANRIAVAGDTNNDGRTDILLSRASYSSGRGRVTLVRGASGGLSTTGIVLVTGSTASTNAGLEIAGVGNVDGDAYDDVAIADGAGNVTLYRGAPTRARPTAWVTISGSAHNATGGALSGAGDVNGDGYADVLVGDNDYDSGLGSVTVLVKRVQRLREISNKPVPTSRARRSPVGRFQDSVPSRSVVTSGAWFLSIPR
jgi:hypothetical protein